MATIIGDCPNHGPVALDYIVGGSGTMTMTGAQASCPLCGAMARIPDGEYSFDDDRKPGWTYFKPITPAQAIRLKTAAEWARQELDAGADQQIVKQKIDAVLANNAPAWKTVIDALLSTRAVNLYQLLGFILMLLVFFGLDPASQDTQPSAPPQISVDQLREMLDEYLEHDPGSDTPLPPLPEPEAPTQEQPPIQGA